MNRAGDLQYRQAQELADAFQINAILAEILFQRGYTSRQAAQDFLYPQLAHLPSPWTMKGMAEACEIIQKALNAKQQIVIHGDYDVDGITATVLLVDFFKQLGLEVIRHLPNRLTEDYGLTLQSVAFLAQKVTMPALLITVDCGTSSIEEVQYAKSLGFTVLITDHHQVPTKRLPKADALINPRQTGCSFAYKALSGVGVAFFLLMAVRRTLVEQGIWTEETMPNLRNFLDLVALGTLADVVPLTEVNRILVRAGLEVLAQGKRIGVQALCQRAGLTLDSLLSAESIAYQIAPRLNAAGRLGKPELAARLLLADDPHEAFQCAEDLEAANLHRREVEALVVQSALQQAKKQSKQQAFGLVLAGEDWHSGVIGIVAAKMVTRYQVPSLVFTDDGPSGLLKGSGRSVQGINLHQVLEDCQEWIVRFGGHAMAAGLTIQAKDLDQFTVAFNKALSSLKQEARPAAAAFDAIIAPTADLHSLAQGLRLFEPFGEGNREPVFLFQNVHLQSVSTLREHLRFFLPLSSGQIQGIGFFMAEHFQQAAAGGIDLGCKVKQTSFRGQTRVEVHAVHILPTGLHDLS
jgi:single-stranded-DNA-specific exonuclease